MSKTVKGTVTVQVTNTYHWQITVPDGVKEWVVEHAVASAARDGELEDGGVYRALDMTTDLDVPRNDEVCDWSVDWSERNTVCSTVEVWESEVTA